MRPARAAGFTIVELLLATAIALVVAAGAVATVMVVARATVSQPRLADEQQRARAAFAQLTAMISRAGEGLGGAGPNEGALLVPALYPQRRGVAGTDPDTASFDDRITVLSEDETRALARMAQPMGSASAPVLLDLATCAPGRPACGFASGARVLIADGGATGEWFSASPVVPDRLDHAPAALSAAYQSPGATVLTRVDAAAIVFDEARGQLRLVRHGSDLPWLDDVVEFRITWLGDPRPPRRPVPEPGDENCVVDAAGSARLPALVADHGPWVRLPTGDLGDGPWCGRPPWRFDADLYRVRIVRLRLAFRGTGPAPAAAPLVLEFDIAPANLVRGG